MKKIILTIILLTIVYFLGKNVYWELTNDLPAALMLSGVRQESVHEQVYAYIVSKLSEKEASEIDSKDITIDTQYVDINNDGKKDVIAILKSEQTCGNAGCLSSIFLQKNSKVFEPVENFLFTVKSVVALDTYTENMRDLRINNDTESSLTWDGAHYVLQRI